LEGTVTVVLGGAELALQSRDLFGVPGRGLLQRGGVAGTRGVERGGVLGGEQSELGGVGVAQ
jgi:hypothetical protein